MEVAGATLCSRGIALGLKGIVLFMQGLWQPLLCTTPDVESVSSHDMQHMPCNLPSFADDQALLEPIVWHAPHIYKL